MPIAPANNEPMMDIDGEAEQYQDPNGKKFRWDETTRSLLWKIVQAEMSIVGFMGSGRKA